MLVLTSYGGLRLIHWTSCLFSVNYSGGIIITDWYSDGNNPDESVKISIRFLTNEVRADALDVKISIKNVIKLQVVRFRKKQDHYQQS